MRLNQIGKSKRKLPASRTSVVTRVIFAAALVSSVACIVPSFAQGNTLADRVTVLEQKAGISSSPNQSIVDRVAQLEVKLFGDKKSGALVERVDKAAQALALDSASGDSESGATASGGSGGSGSSATDTPYPSAISNPPSGAPSQLASPGSMAPASAANSVVILDLFPPNNTAPPHFVRIPPPGKNDKLSEDYYNDVMKATKSKIFRYKSMPVPVYITPYPDKRFTDACIKGFENWEERTSGVVRFVQVEDALKARIRVIWSHLGVATDANDCTLGAHTVTKWKTKAPGKVSFIGVGAVPVPVYIPTLGPKVSVQPQVIEVNLDLIAIKDEEIRMFVLQNVVTHELGHALGLLGHSPERSDMMYPVTDENSRLSARDINTLLKIYEMKADIPL